MSPTDTPPPVAPETGGTSDSVLSPKKRSLFTLSAEHLNPNTTCFARKPFNTEQLRS